MEKVEEICLMLEDVLIVEEGDLRIVIRDVLENIKKNCSANGFVQVFCERINSESLSEEELEILRKRLVNAFEQNLQIKDTVITVRCPLCREMSSISSKQKKVVGLDTQCCVCRDNVVQVYFNGCGHVCVCLECLKRL